MTAVTEGCACQDLQNLLNFGFLPQYLRLVTLKTIDAKKNRRFANFLARIFLLHTNRNRSTSTVRYGLLLFAVCRSGG